MVVAYHRTFVLVKTQKVTGFGPIANTLIGSGEAGLDEGQVMSVEDFEFFEEDGEGPGDGHEAAGEGWGKRDALEVEDAVGEEGAQISGAQALSLGIDRVEPEIVGDNHARRP